MPLSVPRQRLLSSEALCIVLRKVFTAMILRIICFAMLLNATFMSLRVIVSLDALAGGAAPSDVGILMALLCFLTRLQIPLS